tara:strand:- start:1295 stop:1804 length:510 start_codon:yes stop_codon:yes gene_type:complete
MNNSQKHIISVLVDNEPGVLARVVGLFSGRGYNIESLSVSEVDSDRFLSRITIVTSGTRLIISQIKAQLQKLIPVHNLIELNNKKLFIERELLLIKVSTSRLTKKKTLDIANKFNACILSNLNNELIIEMSNTSDKISEFTKALKNFKIIELTRSGLVSMAIGSDYIKK